MGYSKHGDDTRLKPKQKIKNNLKPKQLTKRVINKVSIPPKPTTIKRSGKSWQTIRKQHLKEQPACQACGATTKLEVHHIVPVHIDPGGELNPQNLITLCENPNTGFCHYIFGHLAISWFKWDPYVVNRVTSHLAAIQFAMTHEDANGKALEVSKA